MCGCNAHYTLFHPYYFEWRIASEQYTFSGISLHIDTAGSPVTGISMCWTFDWQWKWGTRSKEVNKMSSQVSSEYCCESSLVKWVPWEEIRPGTVISFHPPSSIWFNLVNLKKQTPLLSHCFYNSCQLCTQIRMLCLRMIIFYTVLSSSSPAHGLN